MIEQKIDNFLNAPDDSINFGDLSKIKLNKNIPIYWGQEIIGKINQRSKNIFTLAETLNS